MPCSEESPLLPEMVLKAKSAGLNKMNAPGFLERELVPFDHQPILQSIMDSATRWYEGSCWHHGCCKKQELLHQSSKLLRKSMMQSIKQQLRAKLPSSSVKDVLISGDLAIAIRFPAAESAGGGSSSSSSAAPVVPASRSRLFLLPKVVLRPEYAVFMEMTPDFETMTGRLLVNPDSGVHCARSMDVVVDLLKSSPASLWINVLEYTNVFLDKTFKAQPCSVVRCSRCDVGFQQVKPHVQVSK